MNFMTGKLRFYAFFIVLVTFASVHTFAQRQWIPLDGSWQFFQGEHRFATKVDFDDSRWQTVTIPHTWNTDIVKGIGYYKGPGWYRKAFQLPADMSGKRVFIRFEGALTVATVYMNNKKVGEHAGGYSAFAFEITPHVKFGAQNLLTVLVDNSDNLDYVPTGNGLFTRYGGIYRPVKLLVTDKTCVTPLDYASPGVYLKQTDITDERAELEILTKVSNAAQTQSFSVRTTIMDADGQTVWTGSEKADVAKDQTQLITQTAVIENPHLWNGKKDPYLYKAVVTLLNKGQEIDGVTQPLGLRYFNVDKDKGFFLNGKYLDLYGVCRHQEWDVIGSALTDEHHRRDMELMLEIGANSIRLAHYQQADLMYQLADENGLVIWAEVPITPPYQKGNPKYMENCQQQLTELIRQNFNHPSILFWGMYNEIRIPLEDVKRYNALMKTEDPTRLTTAASNKAFQERHTVTDLICWNKYDGWYGRKMGIGNWADGMHKKHPNLRFGVSEYGAGGCIGQQQQNPSRPDPIRGQFYPEQYQCYFHEKTWAELKKRPFLWGKYIWNTFDFSWPTVDRGDRELLNHKGLITFDRKTKKDAFYFYKANWSDEPVLYITSRRHTNRIDPETEIKVYSNCDKIQATLNGKSLGTKENGEDGIFRWENITLEDGDNTIGVTGTKDGRQYNDSCIWNFDLSTVPLIKKSKPAAAKRAISTEIPGSNVTLKAQKTE